jgi:pyruvate dehydrogenase E1 component beta subunit
MPKLNTFAAIHQAIAEELERDARVVMFGEGVATKRADLVEAFGERVRNTPLSEAIIAGTAAGAAATGLRPVIDLLFAPFMTYAMDAIVNSAGKLRYLSGGQFSFPMVAMAMTGSGWTVGAQHNHNIEAWFVHSPGLKVVMPSSPADFKGLLKAAIRDDNPVVFFVDMALAHAEGEVPEGEHVVPLGKAAVLRPGHDVTLIAYAKTVHTCMDAAALLAEQGVSAEVIDLRSLKPLDEATVLASVRRTGRAVVGARGEPDVRRRRRSRRADLRAGVRRAARAGEAHHGPGRAGAVELRARAGVYAAGARDRRGSERLDAAVRPPRHCRHSTRDGVAVFPG